MKLGKSLKTIGNYAFYGSKLTGKLILPDTLEWIGYRAFYQAAALSGSLTIPDKVEYIGGDAFYGCTGFKGTLTVGKRVKTLGIGSNDSFTRTFSRCTGITEVILPIMLQNIDSYTFYYCENLKKIKYAGTKDQWKKIGFTSFNNGTKTIYVDNIIEYGYPGFDQVAYRAKIIAGENGHTTTFDKINQTLQMRTPCQICREESIDWAENVGLFCTNIVHEPTEAFPQWNNAAYQAAYEAIIMATIRQSLGKQSLANTTEALKQKADEILETAAFGADLNDYLFDDDFFETIGTDDKKKEKLKNFKNDVYARVGLTNKTDQDAFEKAINLGKVTLSDFVQAAVMYDDLQKTSETMDQILYQMSRIMDADSNLKASISYGK